MINGCGGDDSSEATKPNEVVLPSTQDNFSYKTQRAVKITLSTPALKGSSQRQVLLFETQKTIVEANTPGKILTFESLLAEGNTGNDGKYKTSLTLGGHIESLWILVPSLAYQEKINIINNQIVLNIIEGF
jgi:hypothetical protein